MGLPTTEDILWCPSSAHVLQAAEESSRTSRSPVVPKPNRKSSRSPVRPLSLTFVPHPSGKGGALLPKCGKQQVCSKSRAVSRQLDSQLEQRDSLESDSYTSSPVALPASSGQLSVSASSAAPASLDTDPLPLATMCQTISAYSPIRSGTGTSVTDSCTSETLLLNSTPLLASSNSAADQLGSPVWLSKHASTVSSSPVSPFQPTPPAGGAPHQQMETPHSQIRQSVLFAAPPPVQIASLLQPQYSDQPHLPFQSISPGALPQGVSSPLESNPSSYSITSSPQLSPYAMPLSQPHFQQPNLAQLLMQYPHFCQQQPGNRVPPEFDFDTQQLTQQLLSVGSNLSLSSSSSVCFHETSLADQLDFPLMNSPRGANAVLNSDSCSLSPITSADFSSQMSIVKSELGQGSNSEHCPLETFVAARPGYSRTPMHRVSPSPFYGRAASALTSHAESKVISLLSCSVAFAFCRQPPASCLCLLPSACCLLPLPSACAFCPRPAASCLCLHTLFVCPVEVALLTHGWCNALRHLVQPCSVAIVIPCLHWFGIQTFCLEFAMLCLADSLTTVGLILWYAISDVFVQQPLCACIAWLGIFVCTHHT